VITTKPSANTWLNLPLRSIRGRLALLFGLAFLPAGLMAADAGLGAYQSRQTAYHQTIGAAQLGAMATARDMVTRLRTAARTLSANAALFAYDKADCDETLKNFAKDEPTIGMVAVVRPNLSIVCSNAPNADGQFLPAANLIQRAVRAQDITVGFVTAPQNHEEPALAAVAPAQLSVERSQRFVYVAAALKNVLNIPAASKDARNIYSALTNADGDILMLRNLSLSSDEGRTLQKELKSAPPSQRRSAFIVQNTWAVSAPLDSGGLYILTGWNAASPTWVDFFKAAWALVAPIALWAAAVTSVWIAIEVFVVRPLQVIEDLARAYARNEDTQSYETLLQSAPSEISSLRRSLGALARTLRGRETRLTEALAEQKTLLLEVHHRVKNNLQLITSLLSIQARASDPGEARVLSRANERIQLLSLAHNLIYNSPEVRGIALDKLAEEVGNALVCLRQAHGRRLCLETELEPIRAAADLAVPFAFLLGETLSILIDQEDVALTEDNRISIRMNQLHNGAVRIILSKQHANKPAPLETSNQKIIAAFASQIGATVNFSLDANATIILEIAALKLQGHRNEVRQEFSIHPTILA
jgi:two-component system, sensor histidine kinase PdtaS